MINKILDFCVVNKLTLEIPAFSVENQLRILSGNFDRADMW